MADAVCVLDASALLAHLNDESGAEVVEDALARGAAISAVNLAEVLSKLAEIGEDPAQVSDTLWRRGLLGAKLEVLPLTADDAVLIATLHRKTKPQGLSLGDRACLGLALRLDLPAVTADRTWSRLRVGVKVQMIR
jgi:ribonuclease VapC